MNKTTRTIIGLLTLIIPPCFGAWLWYLWWAEQEEWDYAGKLINWMRILPLPDYYNSIDHYNAWHNPWGKLVFWGAIGKIALFDFDGKILMCGFGGGILGHRRKQMLITLCKTAIAKEI